MIKMAPREAAELIQQVNQDFVRGLIDIETRDMIMVQLIEEYTAPIDFSSASPAPSRQPTR